MHKFFRAVNRTTAILGLLVLAIIFTLILVRYWTNLIANQTILGLVLAGLTAIFALSLKYPKIYLYIIYFKSLIFRTDTIWNLSAKFIDDISAENYRRLILELEKISDRKKIFTQTESHYHAALDGINVAMSIYDILNDDLDSECDYTQSLHFQISDFRAPYMDTLTLLEENIIPYLTKIEQIIKPCKSNYEFTIEFINGNPWAKAVTKGLNPQDIVNLDFTLKIEGPKKTQGKMVMTMSDLRVSCSELSILSILVRKRLMPSD